MDQAMSASKFVSSKVSTVPKPERWTKCSGCRTTVRFDTTPSTCETCEKMANKDLVPCKCGSSEISTYRAKGFSPRNCIRCIFLEYYDARTANQKDAIVRYHMCDGVCGLVQPIGKKFCRDCQACADVNPDLRKKLNATRKTRQVASRNDRWNKSFWKAAFDDFDALIEADRKSELLEAERLRSEQEEKDLFRLLQFAQSGKARVQGLLIESIGRKQDNVPAKKTKSFATVAKVIATKPIVVLLEDNTSSCDIYSVTEFPAL